MGISGETADLGVIHNYGNYYNDATLIMEKMIVEIDRIRMRDCG